MDMANSPDMEPKPDFDKASMDLLRAALKRSHKERFLVMAQLMRRGIMMKNAKITHKPWPRDKKAG
jgi:hypothetical protein